MGCSPWGNPEAIRAALHHEDCQFAESRWSDALSSSGEVRDWAGVHFGSRCIDSRTATIDAPPADVFAAVERIGGETGWYFANWLWGLRGAMDLVIGGIGMRRGRPHPERLYVGDTLDCWRVEALEPGRRLRLAAEMKLPGRAWLEFEVTPEGRHASQLRQTASFDPCGVLGRAYWYLVYPLHQVVFSGMLRGIATASRERDGSAAKEFSSRSASRAMGLLILPSVWCAAALAARGFVG